MFSKEDPHPRQTFKGGSRLKTEIQRVIERKAHAHEKEDKTAAAAQTENKEEA
jgi:hypothetical protein